MILTPSPAEVPTATVGPATIIVGAGRVGRSLALALDSRCRTVHMLTRRPAARAPGPDPGQGPVVEPLAEWCPAAGPARLILAVPDDAIPAVAEELAGRFPAPAPPGWTVLHCSGALASAVLEPFRQRGIPVGSWHPLQTFARPDPLLWSGIPVVMEGDLPAVTAGRELAVWLEAEPVEIAADLRPLYHCLATISCAHEAALLLFCHRALAALPPEARRTLWEGFRRMAIRALADLDPDAPRSTVTGPAARGDRRTIELHLSVLARSHPEWQTVYENLDHFLRLVLSEPPAGDLSL